MNKPDHHRTAPPGGGAHDECCTDLKCESGLKNNYFEGKRLTAETFRVEQRYLIERRRLLNRALYGWGVVYGYAVATEQPSARREASARRLRIGPGLALDECGRELLQVGVAGPDLDDVILLDEHQRRVGGAERERFIALCSPKKPSTDHPRMCWLLSVHYAEQSTSPVPVNDSCRCEHQEWDHTCETVRYSLRCIPCERCCHDFECDLVCECGSGRCCEDDQRRDQRDQQSPRPDETGGSSRPFNRGGCRCLCEHLTNLPIAECGPLCEIEEPCARVRVDLRHGVPLACVELVRDDCERWTFDREVEACGPRRLVKRNDLLFDLIRGCDLTRINEIGWADWHRSDRPIPFADFSDAFGADGDDQHEYVSRDFWLRFSRPVRAETLRADCFAMTVMSVEREGGWWQTLRVPIVRVDTTVVPPQAGDPADHVRGARLIIDGAWIEDGLRGRRSLFYGETMVELEVRGDLIVDCNGQTVDANTIGLAADRTGNGAPGGSLLSTFRVAALERESPARAASPDTARRTKGASS